MTKPKLKAFADLNPEIAADKGVEFEVMAGDEPTGLFLTVVGKESSIYKAAMRKRVNRERQEQFKAARVGRPEAPRTIEQEIEESINIYAECTTGWRGNSVIDEAEGELPFSLDNVKRFYRYDFVRVQAEREILGLSDFSQG